MKTNIFLPALFLAVGLTTGGSASAADIVKPSPAPVIADNAQNGSVDEPAIIDHVVYLAKLPTPEELVKGAELKATPILRMDQTADKIVVVYQYGGGRTVTFAYTLLSTSGASQPQPQQGPVTANSEYRVVSPSSAPPPPTVVYTDPDVVYYSPTVRYYDPAWDFWTPLAVGIGLGWGFGGHGYYYGHGGSYGHGGGYSHGGGHGGHR
jgi:hypothetical protein